MKHLLTAGLLLSGAALLAETIAVPNGDLENGRKSWHLYGTDGKYPKAEYDKAWFAETKDVHAGKGAMRLVDSLTTYRTYVVNPIDFTAGKYKTMTIKAWVKGIQGKSFRLGLMFHRKNGKQHVCVKNFITPLTLTNDWKEYSCTFSVPANCNTVFAMVGAAGLEAKDTGEILFDDVTITAAEK